MHQKVGERPKEQAENIFDREPSKTFFSPTLPLVCQLQKEGRPSQPKRSFLSNFTRSRGYQGTSPYALEALPHFVEERRIHEIDID
jgi:hypothetical protein